MTSSIIITLSALLLIAYIFDLTSAKSRIPSVILLLLLGWMVRQSSIFFEIILPDFTNLLPIFGTVGLILIVLEGSLELELNKSKKSIIKKSFLGALLPMIATAFILALLFQYYGGYSFKNSLINAIPFCVISSAIAIPTVKNLSRKNSEFVIYESSFSDILGVLFFNFVVLNELFNITSFGTFCLQLLAIIVISTIATFGLAFLLSRIEHHIKFVPIILLLLLIYSILKESHLPALIFIMVFGLFIGNLNELKHIKWIQKFKPDELNAEVQKFKELTIEAAFLLRTIFFLLFGYMLETAEIINTETLIWATGIVLIIFTLRAVQLLISKLPLYPLLFIAPRGLITVLLFISILPWQNIELVNNSLVVQVVIITTVITTIGLFSATKGKEDIILTHKSIAQDNLEKEKQEKERKIS
jgi:potassium/hydrogen antiporter